MASWEASSMYNYFFSAAFSESGIIYSLNQSSVSTNTTFEGSSFMIRFIFFLKCINICPLLN